MMKYEKIIKTLKKQDYDEVMEYAGTVYAEKGLIIVSVNKEKWQIYRVTIKDFSQNIGYTNLCKTANEALDCIDEQVTVLLKTQGKNTQGGIR